MKISPLLGKILSEALFNVRQARHQFLTPEHILAAALNSEPVADMLGACGADINQLRSDTADFLDKKVPKHPFGADVPDSAPAETLGFQSVMNRAVFHCVASDRDAVDITDVLVSMFDEKKNYCSYILKTNGIDKQHLIEVIAKIRSVSGGQPNFDANAAPAQEKNSGNKRKTALERYCVNMTEKAKNGDYDTLVGRKDEIERTIQVLCRRVKNNPLHVGDAGVGKTAVTQGLADRIVKGLVPDELKGFSIYSLDLGLMLAGSKFRGDFEERIHAVTDEIASCKKAILFIDEIHMIMGAGSNGNSGMDAANLLKPMLTGGKLRCIGSTTFEEYAKNFEKDRALVRRFQKIDITEPSRDETVKIIEGLLPHYEKYHNVKYSKSVVENAVDLSIQYISDKRLPDKAIDVIDEAGAYTKIKAGGGFTGKAAIQLASVTEISSPDYDVKPRNVSNSAIFKVISKMSRVPVENLSGIEKDNLKNLEINLCSRIFGQNDAVNIVVNAVKRARAGIKNPEKPEACFLFVGPTGVGKTELARSLAEVLGEPLLRYDMSEYQERHTVSRLVGSPPGYVGYDSGGQLTDDVRKNPHSVILFDEIEKAHEDIYNIFLQVMDYGMLTDTQGRKVDFRNCIIIMTSNAGARDIEKGRMGFGGDKVSITNDKISFKEAVEKEFSPEFRNRLDAVVPFAHLEPEIILSVVRKEWKRLALRLEAKKVILTLSPECEAYLAEIGYSREFGARNLSRIVEEKIATPLVDEILFGALSRGGTVAAGLSESDELQNKKITFAFTDTGKNAAATSYSLVADSNGMFRLKELQLE